MRGLKHHKLSCLCCKQEQDPELVRIVHEFKNKPLFAFECEHCNVNLIIYRSVNGYYSVNSLTVNRLKYIRKKANEAQSLKITSKKMIDLSYELIQKRHKLGLRQKDVAELIGVNQSTYSHWEAARSKPKNNMLLVLVNFIKS